MSATQALIELRQPLGADLARAREIVAAAGIFRQAEIDIAVEVLEDATKTPGDDYYALGAYERGTLVGFVCYGPTPGTVATWDLYWIAVDPAVHRQGVGRQLLAACENSIREHGGGLIIIETSSRDDYRATRAFYEAHGYTAAARVPGYYAPRDDLVIYTKSLIPLNGRDNG
ncbi:MAG: GNAT family N-acetyltransferase [Gemmatimonadales bacterium]